MPFRAEQRAVTRDGVATSGLRATLTDPEERLLATFVLIPRVEVIELLAAAGFAAVILDFEHGPLTVSELPPLVAAAQGGGMYALARLADGLDRTIAGALDAGVDGILVPHVSSADDARDLIAAGRFPPDGTRSINPYVRGLGYTGTDHKDLSRANRRTALVAMVEGRAGVAELDRIRALPELDAVFVGPVDMSAALGHPNQPEHPEVIATITECFAPAQCRGPSGRDLRPDRGGGRPLVRARSPPGRRLRGRGDDAPIIRRDAGCRAEHA